MDIGDEREPNGFPDVPDGKGRILVEDGNADDFAACLLESADLFDSGLDVPRVRRGHGLDRHGGTPADGNVSHTDLARHFPCDCRRFAHEFIGLNRILAITPYHEKQKKGRALYALPLNYQRPALLSIFRFILFTGH
jgi:hypothetical protein